MTTKKINPLIYCGCGCGETLLKYDKKYRPRKYLQGHYSKHRNDISAKHLIEYSKANKGKTGLWTKSNIKTRASRYRARQLLKQKGITECQAKSDYCMGILHTHHIDRDPFNNDLNNLLLLCRSHHKLADNRNLLLNALKAFSEPFIVSSGTRRYKSPYWNRETTSKKK